MPVGYNLFRKSTVRPVEVGLLIKEGTLMDSMGQSGHGPHPICQLDLLPSRQIILHGLMSIGQLFIVHIMQIFVEGY